MRNGSSLQIAVATAIFFCVGTLHAQIQPSDTASATDHLNAVVISSIDGKPVPRVLVTSPDRRMAAMTDSEGRFSFDLRRPVPASESHVFPSFPPSPVSAAITIPVQFQVRKPGYLTDNIFLRLPAAAPSTPEATLQLKITPAGVLTGHLDPDSGDLPTNSSIQLLRKMVFNGTANWTFLNTRVNSRGEFRFANLSPGDYKMLAPAFVRYGSLPGPTPDSIPGFRAAFYPNANSLEAATLIHINPGEAVTANLTYHSATFYSVTIPVVPPPDFKGFDVQLPIDIPGLAAFTHDTQSAHGYLPSGDYNVLLTAVTADASPITSIANVHLQVEAKPIRTPPVAFHPTFEIPVLVQQEFTNNLNDRPRSGPPVRVNLLPANLSNIGRTQLITVPGPTPDRALTIKNISEGLFHVDVYSNIGGYVASATSGTTDLLREPLQILSGSAPRPVEVVLRDDPATLAVRLALDPAQQQVTNEQPVFVLCLPLDRPETQPVNSYAQQVQFTIPNLPPGRYLILASHSQLIQNLEYRDQDVIRNLLPKGVAVTLSANQKAEIHVPLMPDGAN